VNYIVEVEGTFNVTRHERSFFSVTTLCSVY